MRLRDFFSRRPAPETLATEYLHADETRREEIEQQMHNLYGVERYRNGTWGPALGNDPAARVYCSECGGYFLPHEH